MGSRVETKVIVLGGLTLLARGNLCPAEPDVGLFHAYFEDIDLLWPKTGKPVPQEMHDRVTEKEWERVEEWLMEAASE